MPFEGLSEKLLRAGIAPRHVRRYRRELEDHLADLTEAQREAGHDGEDAASRARALLGRDEDLAAAMLARPELKSWVARAPWLVFGLAPPIVMMAALFGLSLLLVLTADTGGWIGQAGRTAPAWFQLLAHVIALAVNLLVGPGLAVLLVTMAVRRMLNWKWPVLAISILALTGFHMVVNFPAAGHGGGQVMIATLAEFAPTYTRLLPQQGWVLAWMQILLTLAPLLWLWRAQWFARQSEVR